MLEDTNRPQDDMGNTREGLRPVDEVPEEENKRKKTRMSRAEAGRRGGLSTKKKYGGEHFSQIGRLGGKKGGESTKQRYGVEFYQEIGRKGGSR